MNDSRHEVLGHSTTVFAACLLAGLSIAGCGLGGGDGPFTFALVAGGAGCAGVHLEADVGGVDDTDAVSCTASAAVMSAGCDVSVDVTGDTLSLDLRDCSIPDGAALFSCEAPGATRQALESSATVGCGCGCEDACNDAPAVCVLTGDATDCSESSSLAAMHAALATTAPSPAVRAVAAAAAATPAAVTVTIQGIVTTTSTSSTTCGTCCDAGVTVEAALDDAVTLTELAFTIDLFDSQPGCPMFGDCTELLVTDGPGYARFDATDEKVEVCISDPTGFSGPDALTECLYFTGGAGDPYDVEVTRALDGNFRAVSPLPAVSAATQ